MKSQKELSDNLLKRIQESKVEHAFVPFWKGDVLDLVFLSPRKKLKIILSSQDDEISMFFEDDQGKTDWHTHMSLFGANGPEEEIEKGINLIEEIISGSQEIVASSKNMYWIK